MTMSDKTNYSNDQIERAWAEIYEDRTLIWRLIEIMEEQHIDFLCLSCGPSSQRVTKFFNYSYVNVYLKFKELGTEEKFIDLLKEIKYGNSSDDRNKG
jgi:hypothetical protein